MKHFTFFSSGMKRYLKLYDHKLIQLTTDPLIKSSTMYKWQSRETHEQLVRQIVTEHLCLKQLRSYLRQRVNKSSNRNQRSHSLYYNWTKLKWMIRVSNYNRPFPSSPRPPFPSEAKSEVCHESQFSFILKLELIIITKISLLDSLWKGDYEGNSEMGCLKQQSDLLPLAL